MHITVNPRAIREMTAAHIPPALSLLEDPTEATCTSAYSVRVLGPSRVVYDPARRLANGASVFIATTSKVAVQQLTVEQGLAALAEIEAAGKITLVHTNVHMARHDAKHGTRSPLIAVRRSRSGKATYCFSVEIDGPSLIVSAPPPRCLPCGAKVFLVAEKGVTCTPIHPDHLDATVEDMIDGMEDAAGYVQTVLF